MTVRTRKPFTFFAFVFLTLGCSQTSDKDTGERASAQEKSMSNTNGNNSKKTANWHDSLISIYIHQPGNELIRLAVKNNISEEWFLDRIENRDSANYLIFHIGHDVTDSNTTNPRFVTDGWLYIDSLTRKIYDYDLANDSLIEWRK